MIDSTLFYIIIGILVLQYGIELILSLLNAKKFTDPIPAELTDVFDAEEYERSQRYKKENHRFGLLTSTFSLVLTLAFLLLGGFEWVDQWVQTITSHPILMALLFFGVILLGAEVFGIPFGLYHTFVIEEKYGFNKTTPTTYVTDKIKGWILSAIMGGGVMALIMWFYLWAGPQFWIYAWGLIAAFSIFMNLFYSRLIVPIFNKQVPLEEGNLKSQIETYASGVGFDLKHIFVIDGSKRSTKANAYFSGFGKEKRVALYDTLIKDLEEEEIVAVLAHEIGHYKKKHIIVNLISSLLLTGLMLFILSIFINNPQLSGAIGVSTPSFHAALISFGLLYSPISELTGLIMNYLSRKFEFQADAYAKKTFEAMPLISSLKKLSRHSLSNLTPHPAFVFVHYSHPPLYQRIRELQT
ncbi:MAG: M48 family metallopeptidase [Eudoraea sp.]|nr:M48 family metallopeptidase [Eudoraea sp.]